MPTPTPLRRHSRLPLTARQQQALTLLQNRTLSRKQVAHTLGVSLGTLNAHITGALARLNASSLTQALDLVPAV